MDLGLRDKVCLVTGASVGIGRTVAEMLLAEGAKVIVTARRGELLGQIRGALAAPRDVAAPDAPARLKLIALGAHGRLDVLINNAGGSRPMPIVGADEAWEEGLNLNFSATRRLTEAFIPAMQAQRWGRIVSLTGIYEPPSPNAALAAKAALAVWSKGLSRVLAPDGVTVNCVAPGRIKSEQILEKLHPTEENRRAFIAANIPMGRFGEPEEIASLIVYLASERASYITGELFHVDGGMRRAAF
jgi:3-oxoacyl-[acyl-carrier protein] reductase